MKVALTDRINNICNTLDTNPFIGKAERGELLLELDDLVQKRSRLDNVFKTSWTIAAEEEEKEEKRKKEEENASGVSSQRKYY